MKIRNLPDTTRVPVVETVNEVQYILSQSIQENWSSTRGRVIFTIFCENFFVRHRILKITLNKFLWKVPGKYWAVTQAPTNYIRPWYRTVWNDCVLKTSFQRKFFRKFLKLRCFICVGGRTSLKDADANCIWLNKNRIAEEMGGKIFSY